MFLWVRIGSGPIRTHTFAWVRAGSGPNWAHVILNDSFAKTYFPNVFEQLERSDLFVFAKLSFKIVWARTGPDPARTHQNAFWARIADPTFDTFWRVLGVRFCRSFLFCFAKLSFKIMWARTGPDPLRPH
jgi:hypothetical protein